MNETRILFHEVSSIKMNGGALSIKPVDVGFEASAGSCAEIQRACDRFWEKRERMHYFLRWQKAIREEKSHKQ